MNDCSHNIRVAIVGAGPAGFHAAAELLKASRCPPCHVDMFERIGAPFGLVRHGVAPDHPRNLTWSDWTLLDQVEVRDGEAHGRPRRKFTGMDAMLHALADAKQTAIFSGVLVGTARPSDGQPTPSSPQ